MIEAICRWAWNHFPLSLAWRRHIRDRLFRGCPRMFRRLPAYQRWLLMQHDAERLLGRAERATPDRLRPDEAATVRVIAMHLPQFHRIPENDRWWGEGFTEWTNVRRGRPMYRGHHQPHVPHPDIGHYDLAEAGVLERQAAMARRFGIQGFCFYYYWFNGRRLLEKPLETMLTSGRPDFPFCICWANEPWTRTWDGLDRDVLVEQHHDPESDRRFIEDVLPFLRDDRSIRVEDRPFLAVYRADRLSDPRAVAAAWRARCREAGVGDIHLCSVWSRDRHDPRALGFDSALQFPPLVIGGENLARDEPLGLDPVPEFRGAILDYRVAVSQCTAPLPPGYPVFRGVMPSWDNTARRMERGVSWIHASPRAYGRWLREALRLTCREQSPARRLVFVNAWNEWAEGAHLEPDERLGYAVLEETRAACAGMDVEGRSWMEAGSPQMAGRLGRAGRDVLVDLLFCQPGFHGGGEYGKAVFEALVAEARIGGEVTVWAALDPDTFMEPWVWELCADDDVPVVAVRTKGELLALVAAGRFESFFTPGLVAYADEFASAFGAGTVERGAAVGTRRPTRIIGTVHDVREVTLERELPPPAAVPGLPRPDRATYAAVFASPRIDTIVTVSEHSRHEILRLFGPPHARLVVLTPPAKRRASPDPFLIGGRHDPAAMRYALIVNAGRPEKNAGVAVRAFDELFEREKGCAGLAGLTVVVSGIDAIRDLGIHGLRHPERFVACPACLPGQFEFLLQRAEFLVYPSLEEGFGYPPVEAMHHGVPTVAANIGAIREVCGDAAIFCDPRDVADVARAIVEMAGHPPDAEVLRRRSAAIAERQQHDLRRLVRLIWDDGDDPALPAAGPP